MHKIFVSSLSCVGEMMEEVYIGGLMHIHFSSYVGPFLNLMAGSTTYNTINSKQTNTIGFLSLRKCPKLNIIALADDIYYTKYGRASLD